MIYFCSSSKTKHPGLRILNTNLHKKYDMKNTCQVQSKKKVMNCFITFFVTPIGFKPITF